MNRISERFKQLASQGKKALIPYVTAGDPNPSVTVPLMHAMVASGADIIELGVPFSDPMADGPVIQAACERALKHRVSLRHVLGMVAEFRQKDTTTPVVLMGYLNPVERMGYNEFAQQASLAGVDGLLTVDMPPEESRELLSVLEAKNIHAVFLLAPTSTAERVKRVASVAKGFLYYVSLKGVTGAQSLDVVAVKQKVEQLKTLTSLPIGVGFGIKDAESARQVAQVADAVVVGSAIVKRIEALQHQPQAILPEIAAFIADVRSALDKR